MSKKSYSPFKMWLVWTILILGILFDGFLIYWAKTCTGDMCGFLILGIAIIPLYIMNLILGRFIFGGWIGLILMSIIQLLILVSIGYGLTLLWRLIRK